MENIIIQTDENKSLLGQKSRPCFAIVKAYENGKAQIQVDGEKKSNEIFYECIQSCEPDIGDRVFFLRTGSTIVIIGVINKVGGTKRHIGNKIGFFGQLPVARAPGIASVAENATLPQLITEYNKLIAALDFRGYGLIE